ncbi:MAG: CAP domain-containing protein, partial [Actinomycetota bacterium]
MFSLVLACLGASALASPRLRVAGISLPCPGGAPQAFTAGKSFFAYAGQEAPDAPLETVHEVLELPLLEPVVRPVFNTANALLPPEVHEAALLTLVNTERATAGLSALQTNGFAQTTARSWSQQMVAARAISHNDAYIATGRAGTGGDALGENVACDYSIPTMHTGLMNSPSHR